MAFMTGAMYATADEFADRHPMLAAFQQPSDVYAAVAEGGGPVLAVSGSAGQLEVRWANAAALRLLDLTASEAARLRVHSGGVLRHHEVPHWTTVIAQAIEAEDDLGLDDWRSATADGPDRTISSVQVMVRRIGADSFVVWLRPVTAAQQMAEEAQRESEHRFRALAEYAPVGIIESEAGVRLGFVNNRFAEITGVERTALVGTRWLRTIYPEDLPALLETLDEVLAGASAETTVRMYSVADSQRWVQLRLSPVTTPRRSAGFIGTVEDITARRAWETQLAYQAGHDALTGLDNRRSLVEALSQLLGSRRTRDKDTAVLFCDLDGFKQINDRLGHDAGDRVLIEVGQRLTSTARDHDLVARIAGDEFVVMIREVGSFADAEAAAVRQLDALVPPIRVAGQVVHISASIGVAMARDYDGATALLQAADRGMYEAKRAGRGLFRHSIPLAGGSDA
jgi:diguanylate cyclase (GGDEF)-like protein/PAS domain S-box-containing protein